jgi:glucose/arabinose dehydrogenase
VDEGAEQGLFALAFHPDYATNGYFYVTYTAAFPNDSNKWNLRLSQIQVTSNPDVANPNSEVALLNIVQDFALHNGGSLEFNPRDGRLYMGVGDDSQNLVAQNDGFKGKILRIDVGSAQATQSHGMQQLDEDTTASTAVSIETWARGLRNPWRMAVDPVSGNIFVGDVGDRSWEEIDMIPFGYGGSNFGWPCVEGPEVLFTDGDCDKIFDPPIHYYSEGCSVILGEYFRFGGDLSRKGSLIFADGCLQQIQALSFSEGSWQVKTIGDLAAASGGFLTTFGQDINGTVYAGVLGTPAPLLELYIPPQ